MSNPIEPRFCEHPSFQEKGDSIFSSPLKIYESSISSAATAHLFSEKIFLLGKWIGQQISTIYFKVLEFCQWIISRIIPTNKELKMLEQLLEDSILGGGLLLYDRKRGEEKLNQVMKNCEELYQKISEKWFPNLEEILFLRRNLIKVMMRISAALGREKEVVKYQSNLRSIGGEISEEIEDQVQLFLQAAKPRHHLLVRMMNYLTQIFLKFILKK